MHIVGKGLGHWFDATRPLFSGVDLKIGDGDLIAVTGPSGSGKSTLLGLLAGWMVPREGSLTRTAVRIQWVFQNPFGSPYRTALDHVRIAYLAAGMSIREAETCAYSDLERLGLGEIAEAPYRDLSGGEAQRLMMARAIATKPDLLLMDEPTAQLDPVNAAMVIDTLRMVAGTGRAVVIATHDERVRDACFTEIRLGALP